MFSLSSKRSHCLAILLVGALGTTWAQAAEPLTYIEIPPLGEARFVPTSEEPSLPDMFRQKEQSFVFSTKQARELNKIRMFKVTFPSPVETDVPQNATVHAEYFQPPGPGPFPGVIMLHILGGDFILSETISQHLAQQGIATLFVKMPYYGERRGTNGRRMISKNPAETVEGMRQAVLDIRRATAWLAERPEVDSQRLGITGISLGGIMATLSASLEPRIQSVAPYLAGGNFGEVIWIMNKREAEEFRQAWLASGESKETFANILKAVDPTTHAPRLRGRRVLMVNADADEVIPPVSTEALWASMDKQPDIIWLNGGHYTVARYLPFELFRISSFFLGAGKPALVLRLERMPNVQKPDAQNPGELKLAELPRHLLKVRNVGAKPFVLPKSAGKFTWRIQRDGQPVEESPQPCLLGGQVVTLAPGASMTVAEDLLAPAIPGQGAFSISVNWAWNPAEPSLNIDAKLLEMLSTAPKFQVLSNVLTESR